MCHINQGPGARHLRTELVAANEVTAYSGIGYEKFSGVS